MKGPVALKALYDEFVYIFEIDLETVAEEFAERNPTLDDYNDEVQRLHGDIARINEKTLNEVAFELIKVPPQLAPSMGRPRPCILLGSPLHSLQACVR